MPASEDEQRQPGTGARMLARLRQARLALVVLAAGCVLLSLEPEVGPVHLFALFAAVLVVVLVSGSVPEILRRADPPTRPAASIWPDTSMKMLVEALPDPCFIADRNGILRYANKAAVASFGPARPGDPLSFKLRVPELLAAVDRTGRGGVVETIRFTDRNPTERFFEAAISAVRLGRIEGKVDFVLIRLSDRTDLVRMERMRGDFIANASHELRTPLASLKGFVETLLGPARNDEVNRERFLRIMLEQGERMARLIDDLLSLSRIEMKAHVQPDRAVDLEAVLRHTLGLLETLARENGTEIVVERGEGPFVVRGDQDELVQVLSNLVENAVKYGREGGRVEIGLARVRDRTEPLAPRSACATTDPASRPSTCRG
ncbi:histidine kinase dimerization/phospho-acceptor domain-containing protein [Methylobrevis pamukkalensis]|uniref:histidine kinase n=1 Tax=Methylobrevis pamukkalensis TaxID=1439726 RepID=A0A1E3H0J5_9HYPH|nr:histidine kinase dimerization/phospho-acceptor domain-containing protein [Methylobrevis pamukkalensis]ODN69820.1 Alkaline phosphatase synthesis sensor protein PhoR [Methylobrevis pamukkalensis]